MPAFVVDALPTFLDRTASFKLGGAAVLPEKTVQPSRREIRLPRFRLPIPSILRDTDGARRNTSLSGLALFFSESWQGREVFHLGSTVTRGQTTAGVSVTYEEELGDVISSELFVDYALTEHLSVGLTGTLGDDTLLNVEHQPLFGISAEVSSQSGAYLQGGVAETENANPVYGLALGLRF